MYYKYQRTFTSGGKITSTADQVIKFTELNPINGKELVFTVAYLSIETFDKPLRIKLNKENTIHWIDANKEVVFTDFAIDKFTILDVGVEYYYTAFVPNN